MPELHDLLREHGKRLDRQVAPVGLSELEQRISDDLTGIDQVIVLDEGSPVLAPGTTVTLIGTGPAPTRPLRRRRSVIAVAAAAVVIGVAGLAVVPNDDDQSPAPVATVSVAPTTNVAPTETVAPVSQEWRFSTTEIDPRAAELDIKIVVVKADELVEYDTGTGERASIPISAGIDPGVEAGQDWIRLGTIESSSVDLYQGRDRPVRIPGDVSVREPGTDMFWAVEGWHSPGFSPDDPVPLRVHETDFAGNETGVSFDLGLNQMLAADPAGGVVVQEPDGIYHVDPETGASSLITTGTLIALNAQTALVAYCDTPGSCVLVVLDRVTGESRELTPDHMPQYLQFCGDISPNGRYAPYNYRNGILGVVDLTSGESTNLPTADWEWSPDGSRLLYVRDRRLFMYDFDDGAEIPIVPDSDGLVAFAVRT